MTKSLNAGPRLLRHPRLLRRWTRRVAQALRRPAPANRHLSAKARLDGDTSPVAAAA
jgi:hypothetical protein